MANLNSLRFDSISPEALEAAEGVVRHLNSPFTTRAFRGAHEAMLAANGKRDGARARSTAANERTASALRAIDETKMRFRFANRVATEEDLQPFVEAHERAKESEEAALASGEHAASVATAATTVFHKMVLRLFDSASRGETLRGKKVTPRSGDAAEASKANLSEQRAKRGEVEPVRNSTPTNPIYEGQIAGQLDELADPFKISYADGTARWSQPIRMANGKIDQHGHYITERDLLPLIVALNRDEIQRRLFERIEQDHAGDSTLRLTPEEKHERLGKLRAELLELEREEAALRVALAGDSPEIAFRPEMSPLATLGLEVVAGKPAEPAKPTKKGRSGQDVVRDALASIGIEL